MFNTAINETNISSYDYHVYDVQSIIDPNSDKIGFEHIIQHVTLYPFKTYYIATHLFTSAIYTLEGNGELIDSKYSILFENLKRGRVVFLPQSQCYSIYNDQKKPLKFLEFKAKKINEVCDKVVPFKRKAKQGDSLPCDIKGLLMRNILHPEWQPVQIPYCLGDTVIQNGSGTHWNKWKVSVCHIVTEGRGNAIIGGNQTLELKRGTVFHVPASTWWKVQSSDEESISYLSILNQCWKNSYDESASEAPPRGSIGHIGNT